MSTEQWAKKLGGHGGELFVCAELSKCGILTAMPSRRHSSAMLCSARRPSSTMRIFFGGILSARRSANVVHDLLGGQFRMFGFLAHFHSLTVTMSQNSSFPQPAKFVSKALTPDTLSELARAQQVKVCGFEGTGSPIK
jgi:hypothetical protein